MASLAAESKAPQAGGDGADLEDSNMAGIGGAEDKAARKAAAEGEEAWVGAGTEVGVQVWRIEKFQVVAWPVEEYGNFYTGDSYIVLSTYKEADSDKLLMDIHFWLGTETTQDEMGTAAYKTVELDDLKDGLPVQHREVQGHESQAFQKLFGEIHYMEGGVDSGFNHVEEGAFVPRLEQVRKTAHTIKCTAVPCNVASLHHGDCFVLDAGKVVYSWHGDNSSPFEKAKCTTVAANMASSRNGKAVHQQGADDAFWAALAGAEADVRQEGEDAPAEEEIGEGKLFKLSDATGELVVNEVGRGDLTRSMLDTNDVFLVDTGAEIFIWAGLGASDKEKSSAFATADNYLQQNARPMHTPVHFYREGQAINNDV